MACCACVSSLRLSSVSAVAFWVIYRVTDLLMDHGSQSGWIKVQLEFDDLAYGGRRSLLQGSSLIHGLMLNRSGFCPGMFLSVNFAARCLSLLQPVCRLRREESRKRLPTECWN